MQGGERGAGGETLARIAIASRGGLSSSPPLRCGSGQSRGENPDCIVHMAGWWRQRSPLPCTSLLACHVRLRKPHGGRGRTHTRLRSVLELSLPPPHPPVLLLLLLWPFCCGGSNEAAAVTTGEEGESPSPRSGAVWCIPSLGRGQLAAGKGWGRRGPAPPGTKHCPPPCRAAPLALPSRDLVEP